MSNPRTKYETHLREIIDHNPLVRELIIEFPDDCDFRFRAGQFVMLHLPGESQGKPILRAYSLASDERQPNRIRLILKFVPGGIASQFVWSLKPAAKLIFTGPFGRVWFHEPPSEQIIFLCTGTGLAQHLCYLSSKADQYPTLKYRLFLGLTNESDLFLENELQHYQKQLRDFEYHMVLSKPSSQWQGKVGYIQDFLHLLDYRKLSTNFYLCGNGHMIRDTKALLTERDGIDPTKIFSEAFH